VSESYHVISQIKQNVNLHSSTYRGFSNKNSGCVKKGLLAYNEMDDQFVSLVLELQSRILELEAQLTIIKPLSDRVMQKVMAGSQPVKHAEKVTNQVSLSKIY
jgi:hypothetical protein